MRVDRTSFAKRLKTAILIIAIAGLGAAGVNLIRAEDSSDGRKVTQPRYAEGKQLMLPEDYRSWVYVGASIGLSYSDAARDAGPGAFHHVYLQPEAYEQFKRTGKFPEKTILVMEVHKP